MAGAADPGPHARAAELLAAEVLRVAGLAPTPVISDLERI